MAFIRDVGKFEGFNLKRMLKKIGDDPERVLLGAADPLSSKMWGGITGKEYEPIVNQWGGASDDTYKAAEDAGIRTKSGRKMHDLAETIAAFYTGKWAAGLGGGGAGGSTPIPNSVNLSNAGGSMSTGSAGTYGGGLNVSPSAMTKWGKMANLGGNAAQQIEGPPDQSPELSMVYAEDMRYSDPYAQEYGYSSKRLKHRKGEAKGSDVAKALHSGDPIDQNGAEIAMIQALTKQLEQAKAKLAALKKAKGRR